MEEDTEGVLAFTCKDCGAKGLVVECFSTLVTETLHTLVCECGDAPDGFAVEFTSHARTAYKQSWPLDEQHRCEDEEENEELETETEEGQHLVHCAQCFDAASEGDWGRTCVDPEVDEDSSEFYVRCAGCDREVEFGWSHPGRGGRLWPAESSDFNPWKTWPEPRYRESWLNKGWIPPQYA